MLVASPFSGSFSPASCRWWMASIERHYRPDDPDDYSHFGALLAMLGGKSADDTEQLEYCHSRVVGEGARSVSGLWCVCLAEDAPATAERRGAGGGDGMGALVAVKADLEFAADSLPISWKSTERIFQAQGRGGVWGARFTYYNRNLKVRAIDRWLEPRDPDSGRAKSTQLAFFMMSLALGGTKTECRWPRSQSLVERNVFTARIQERVQQEAA